MDGNQKGKIVLLSVLGSTSYKEVWYELGGKKYSSPYIQYVLCQHLKKLHPDMEFKIFLTTGARERNWEELPGEKDQKLKHFITEGRIPYEEIDITDGTNEEEIWQNFNHFYDALEEGDQLYVDITHSFRSIPVILLSVLNLAKKTKNISVKEIYYGSYDQSKGEENLNSVISLVAYDQITEWENAISRFMETGRAKKIADMAEKFSNTELGKLFTKAAETDGAKRRDEQKNFFGNIKKLSKVMQKFSEELLSVRGLKILETVGEMQEILKEIDATAENKGFLNPFMRIIGQIGDLLEPINRKEKTEVENINEIVRLCLRFGLIQQGLTFLEENTTTHLHNHIDWELLKQKDIMGAENIESNVFCREKAETCFFQEMEGKRKDMDLCFDFSDGYKEKFYAMRKNLKGLRNDINHAGFNNSPAGYIGLQKGLEDNLRKFEEIIKQER